jgi:hypothetical protein
MTKTGSDRFAGYGDFDRAAKTIAFVGLVHHGSLARLDAAMAVMGAFASGSANSISAGSTTITLIVIAADVIEIIASAARGIEGL